MILLNVTEMIKILELKVKMVYEEVDLEIFLLLGNMTLELTPSFNRNVRVSTMTRQYNLS